MHRFEELSTYKHCVHGRKVIDPFRRVQVESDASGRALGEE